MSCGSVLAKNGSLGLPPEVLVDIFRHSLPPDHIRLSTPPQLLPPLILSQVCSHWRNLALSSPQLWSRIVLGRYGADSAKEMQMLGLWLEGAGSEIPLEIVLDPQDDNPLEALLDKERASKYERDTLALIQRFCENMQRVRSLELHVLDADILEPLFEILGQRIFSPEGAFAAAAPLLEELELSSMHLGHINDIRILSHIAHSCPRLRSVRLMCPTVLPGEVVLNSMREVDLRFCTDLSHALAWVDACPNLELLKTRVFSRLEGQDDPEIDEFDGLGEDIVDDEDENGWVVVNRPRPQVNRNMQIVGSIPGRDIRYLNQLSSLEVQGFSSAASVGMLLDYLATPALRCLKVSSAALQPGSRNARWLHVPLLLHRSVPPLEELEIVGVPMNVDDIRASLMLASHLRRFSVGMVDDLDSVLVCLMGPASNGRSASESEGNVEPSLETETTLLCPRLEILDVADATFSIDVLASVISSRFAIHSSDPQDLKVARLKELVVDTSISKSIAEHPVIAACVAEGLKFTEEEPDSLMRFRVVE